MLGLPLSSADPMMLCPEFEPWKIDKGAKVGSGMLLFTRPNIVVSSVQANFNEQILSSKARKLDVPRLRRKYPGSGQLMTDK